MAGLPSIRRTTNRVLAAIALGLGVIALAGNPLPSHTVRIDTQELATIVSSEVDHVEPAELADWILRGATDYRLVDLRLPEAYAAYHIPTAENVPLRTTAAMNIRKARSVAPLAGRNRYQKQAAATSEASKASPSQLKLPMASV